MALPRPALSANTSTDVSGVFGPRVPLARTVDIQYACLLRGARFARVFSSFFFSFFVLGFPRQMEGIIDGAQRQKLGSLWNCLLRTGTGYLLLRLVQRHMNPLWSYSFLWGTCATLSGRFGPCRSPPDGSGRQLASVVFPCMEPPDIADNQLPRCVCTYLGSN